MFVTYTPEDGDRVEWEFDPKRVRQSEAEIVERRYSGTWAEFVRGVQVGDSKARRVLLWHLLRRQHHTLRYEDTPDFLIGEITVEHSTREVDEIREALLKAPLSDDEREEVLKALEMDAVDARPAGDGEGKAS